LTAAGAIIFTGIFWITGQTGHPPQSDFRSVFAYINSHWHDGDQVILRDGSLFTAAEYYHSPTPYIGLPYTLITDTSHILHANEAISALTPLAKQGVHGIWLVAWQGDVMDPEDVTAGLLETIGTDQAVNEPFGDVSLDYFALNKPLSEIQGPILTTNSLAATPDGVTLQTVSLATLGPLHPGDPIVAHGWWQRGANASAQARVSIRLVGSDGKTYGQQDQPPAGWFYYPDHWPEQISILGRYAMTIPPDAPDSIMMLLIVYSTNPNMKPVEVPVGTVQIVRSGG
jgi:hypothetical protein